MGTFVNLDNEKSLDRSSYRIINGFCAFIAISGISCAIFLPEAVMPKQNKPLGLLVYLSGLCSGLTLVGCGWYLRDKENMINAIDRQKVELTQHELAFSRVLIEQQREQKLALLLEGDLYQRTNSTVPVSPMPSVSHIQNLPPEKDLPALPAPDNSFDGRKDQLWQLIQNEAEWLGRLLKRKPLLIVGPQGSGKTTFVKFLALLRTLFLEHEIKISDPHAHNNSWVDEWEVVGENYNYKAIDKALKGYFDRLKSCKNPTTSIWDECTNYADNCQSEYAKKFLKSVLADCRKSNEFPILLSHGETLSNLGGGTGGASKMKQEGLTTLKLLRQSDSMGVDMPAFRGYLSGLDYADDGKPISYSIELKPEWMSPDYLFNLFPELLSGNRSFKDEEIEVFSPIPDRPRRVETAEELESKILSFCQEKRSSTVRDIQNKFRAYGIKCEAIKLIFQNLAKEGFGDVSERRVGGKISIVFTAKDTSDTSKNTSRKK